VIRDYKFIQSILFSDALVEVGGGVITTSTSSANVDGLGADFVGNGVSAGDRLYTKEGLLIGVVDNVVDDDVLNLASNALIEITLSEYLIGEEATLWRFELRDATIAMIENVRNYELINEELIQQHVSWRPVFGFSTPYIRRANTGSYDFLDVINEFDTGEVYVLLPEVRSETYKVIKDNDTFSVGVNRHFIRPSVDFACRSVSTITNLPDWYKFTKSKPSYL
jgi:hypothetical protein